MERQVEAIQLERGNVAQPQVDEVANLRQMRRSGKPVVIPNLDEYPGWLWLGSENQMKSYAGAPIRLDGEIIGGVASSGSSQTMDDECARAGLAKAEELLN